MEMTFTETREQIFANAMRLFPKAVEEHLAKYTISHAKPEDIFDISTVRVGMKAFDHGVNFAWIPSDRISAVLSYHPHGSLAERRTAIAASSECSRQEAVCQLLTATEHALGIFVNCKEAWDQNKIEVATGAGGYTVDSQLLLQGLTSAREAITKL